MLRVLLISPHFPPDFSAATHRVRLLAPYLARYGWDPTVLTVEPGAYEAALDHGLAAMVPSSLKVVRCKAWSPRLSRHIGVGDLGLRSFDALYRASARLLRAERFDALFITIFPAYTALLGPLLARRFGVPFVLDYQDPWLNAWGVTVGGGKNGAVDLKSRVTRWLAEWLEPMVVRSAKAITAVSAGTYEPVLERNPAIAPVLEVIPIGTDPADFTHDVAMTAADCGFDPHDGNVHLCSTGTFPPLGFETLTAMLEALALVRDRRPDLYRRARLHFFGTSGQSRPSGGGRILHVAERAGVADVVTEVPARLPYSTIIAIQKQATALLALGSSEPHYTASRIFPFLLARRPILGVYHESSTVTDLLRRVSRPPSVRLLTYSDAERAATRVGAIFQELAALIEAPIWNEGDVDMNGLSAFFAENLAGRLARVLDQAVERAA